MRMRAPAAFLPIVVLTMACSEQGASRLTSTGPTAVGNSGVDVAQARPSGVLSTVATHSSATVQFGQTNVGSAFPPPSGHDQSAHAVDNMVPRTVVIDTGGTVTFNVPGVHEVAIYEPGTDPDDIDTSMLILMPPGCPRPGGEALMINDPENRVALYAQPCLPGGATRVVTHTFTEPGRYLVICAFLPHFQVQMYGWVEVRDR
jgi:plastocyanin